MTIVTSQMEHILTTMIMPSQMEHILTTTIVPSQMEHTYTAEAMVLSDPEESADTVITKCRLFTVVSTIFFYYCAK